MSRKLDFYDLFNSQLLRNYHKEIGFKFTPEQEFYLIQQQGAFLNNSDYLRKTKHYIKNTILPKISNDYIRKLIEDFLKKPNKISYEYYDINDDTITGIKIPVPFKHGDYVSVSSGCGFYDDCGILDMIKENEFRKNNEFDYDHIINVYTLSNAGYICYDHIDIFNIDYCKVEIKEYSSIKYLHDIFLKDDYQNFIKENGIWNN